MPLAAALSLSLIATDAFAQHRGSGGGGMRAGLGGDTLRGGGLSGIPRTGVRVDGGGVRTVSPGGFRGGYGYRDGRWAGGGRHWGGRRYWRGPGWGVGAGLAAGALLSAPYYYDSPYYYGDDHTYEDDGPVITYGYGTTGPDGAAECAERFRSYDPRTSTYRGYDGLDHPCP